MDDWVRLKLNDDKTEFLVIFSPSFDVPQLSFKAGNNAIKRSQSCHNLGVIFDSKLNMKLHINNVCKTSFFHLRNISVLGNISLLTPVKNLYIPLSHPN